MRKYDRWNDLHNKSGKVVLKHNLFGTQEYICDDINVVNDGERIGVEIKGNKLFVYKERVAQFSVKGDVYVVADDMLEIRVIVNRL